MEILIDHWKLALILTAVFLGAVFGTWVLLAANRDRALRLADKLDRKRKNSTLLYKVLLEPHGALKATIFVFVNNLLASLLLFSLGGLLLVPPPLYLVLAGRLGVLILAKYPERRKPALLLVVPIEVGAFILASMGGMGVAMSLLTGGDVTLAGREWMRLFLDLAVPLLFIAAVFEGVGLHRIYIRGGTPLPEKVLRSLGEEGRIPHA